MSLDRWYSYNSATHLLPFNRDNKHNRANKLTRGI